MPLQWKNNNRFLIYKILLQALDKALHLGLRSCGFKSFPPTLLHLREVDSIVQPRWTAKVPGPPVKEPEPTVEDEYCPGKILQKCHQRNPYLWEAPRTLCPDWLDDLPALRSSHLQYRRCIEGLPVLERAPGFPSLWCWGRAGIFAEERVHDGDVQLDSLILALHQVGRHKLVHQPVWKHLQSVAQKDWHQFHGLFCLVCFDHTFAQKDGHRSILFVCFDHKFFPSVRWLIRTSASLTQKFPPRLLSESLPTQSTFVTCILLKFFIPEGAWWRRGAWLKRKSLGMGPEGGMPGRVAWGQCLWRWHSK